MIYAVGRDSLQRRHPEGPRFHQRGEGSPVADVHLRASVSRW